MTNRAKPKIDFIHIEYDAYAEKLSSQIEKEENERILGDLNLMSEKQTVTVEEIKKLFEDPQKKQEIMDLFESFAEIDAQIEPYLEQRKDLREHMVKEKGIVTNEQYSLLKKAYNAAKPKSNIDIDALKEVHGVCREVFKKMGLVTDE